MKGVSGARWDSISVCILEIILKMVMMLEIGNNIQGGKLYYTTDKR